MKFLLNFCNLHKILYIVEKRYQLHSLNVSEVIDFEKCGY